MSTNWSLRRAQKVRSQSEKHCRKFRLFTIYNINENYRRGTSLSVWCGVSVSMELSLVEVMAEAMDVGVSSSSLADGFSEPGPLTSRDKGSGWGPSKPWS